MQRPIAIGSLVLFVLTACGAKPPPRWAEGGAALQIPRAHWERRGQSVDLWPDGRVFVDGDHLFSVDSAGRIFEQDGEPIAVLQPDGLLIGRNNRVMGHIGIANAALPGIKTAWLTIGPNGEVIRYEDDGERVADGIFTGCGGAVRACTLTAHVIALEELRQKPRVSIGIGIGVGFGR